MVSDLGLHCWLMTILQVPGKNGLRRTCQQAIGLYRWPAVNFQLTWTKSRKSYCTTPGVGVGIGSSDGVGGSKKFNVKVFYVMGKACQASYPVPVTGLVVNSDQYNFRCSNHFSFYVELSFQAFKKNTVTSTLAK